jgi:putative endonuclease
MEKVSTYYVYVLQNAKGNLYKGFTSDIAKRLREHNTGVTKATRLGAPWKVVYFEEFDSKEEAIKREKYFKSAAGRRFLKTKVLVS